MSTLPAGLLDRYPPELRPLALPVSLGNAGGFSGARLWRYPSRLGPMVVRAWPAGGRGRAEIQAIHTWLAPAEALGFVPVPRRARGGATIQNAAGTLWEVAPWMPGEPERGVPPPIPRVRAAFSALAAVHRLLGPRASAAYSPGMGQRLREIESLPRALADWRAIVRTSDKGESRDLAFRWIEQAARIGPALAPEIRAAAGRLVAVQPVIRDARPDHVLFTADRVTGLVDYGAMGIDPVSADLARLLSEWIGADRSLRAEALDAYARVRPLSDPERALIGPFERATALLSGGRWVRWHFLDRLAFDDPGATLRGLRRGVERLDALGQLP